MASIFKLIPYKLLRSIRKYANINALLFSYAKENSIKYIAEDSSYSFKFYNIEEKLGYKVMTGFIRQTMSYITPHKLQREYIINGGKCIIEPKYGWGIQLDTTRLIKDSVIYNRQCENYYPSWCKLKFRQRRNDRYFKEVVSIRMIKGAEKNYWHFLSDMLGIVVLIEKHNFSKDIPLVIPKKLADQNFFWQVVNYSDGLKNRNWIIQDKEYIIADNVYFCQKMPNQKDQFEGLLKLLKIPGSDLSLNRKIYVTRSAKRIRFIKNNSEIQAIAEKYGFEVIDCDNLSFTEQVKLFSSCSHIIGIHGAGLTNIVWRQNAPLTLLELFPENYVHPGYFWLAKSFDADYFALTGSDILDDTSFSLNITEFENKIKEMLKLC